MPVLSVHLSGAEQPFSAGKEAALTCTVRGSRPAPLVTWFLDERVLSESTAVAVSKLEIGPRPLVTGPAAFSRFHWQSTQTAAGWNETRSVIRFVPGVEDRAKKLTCRARNANASRGGLAYDLPPLLEPLHVHDPSVEDARFIVVHGTRALAHGSSQQRFAHAFPLQPVPRWCSRSAPTCRRTASKRATTCTLTVAPPPSRPSPDWSGSTT